VSNRFVRLSFLKVHLASTSKHSELVRNLSETCSPARASGQDSIMDFRLSILVCFSICLKILLSCDLFLTLTFWTKNWLTGYSNSINCYRPRLYDSNFCFDISRATNADYLLTYFPALGEYSHRFRFPISVLSCNQNLVRNRPMASWQERAEGNCPR